MKTSTELKRLGPDEWRGWRERDGFLSLLTVKCEYDERARPSFVFKLYTDLYDGVHVKVTRVYDSDGLHASVVESVGGLGFDPAPGDYEKLMALKPHFDITDSMVEAFFEEIEDDREE